MLLPSWEWVLVVVVVVVVSKKLVAVVAFAEMMMMIYLEDPLPLPCWHQKMMIVERLLIPPTCPIPIVVAVVETPILGLIDYFDVVAMIFVVVVVSTMTTTSRAVVLDAIFSVGILVVVAARYQHHR